MPKSKPSSTTAAEPVAVAPANLSTAALAGAERVSPYPHPDNGRTVAVHADGNAYTVTGVFCGAAVKAKG